MTMVVKLGSSIVAAEGGELRTDVLDGVCAQVADLEGRGERVVMVTSGGIARGRGRRGPPEGGSRGGGGCGGCRSARARWTSCRPPRRSARETSFAPTRRGSRR